MGFNGGFYRPQGLEVTKPRKWAYTLVLTGFVADNDALYELPCVFHFLPNSPCWLPPLAIVEIEAGSRLYPFVFSQVIAKDIPNYSFVKVKGRWRKKDGLWYLLATSF